MVARQSPASTVSPLSPQFFALHKFSPLCIAGTRKNPAQLGEVLPRSDSGELFQSVMNHHHQQPRHDEDERPHAETGDPFRSRHSVARDHHESRHPPDLEQSPERYRRNPHRQNNRRGRTASRIAHTSTTRGNSARASTTCTVSPLMTSPRSLLAHLRTGHENRPVAETRPTTRAPTTIGPDNVRRSSSVVRPFARRGAQPRAWDVKRLHALPQRPPVIAIICEQCNRNTPTRRNTRAPF